jgi:hypothetical protein
MFGGLRALYSLLSHLAHHNFDLSTSPGCGGGPVFAFRFGTFKVELFIVSISYWIFSIITRAWPRRRVPNISTPPPRPRTCNKKTRKLSDINCG